MLFVDLLAAKMGDFVLPSRNASVPLLGLVHSVNIPQVALFADLLTLDVPTMGTVTLLQDTVSASVLGMVSIVRLQRVLVHHVQKDCARTMELAL